MKTELSIHESDYEHKEIVNISVNSASEIFAVMVINGGLPDRHLCDVYHDVIQLQHLFQEAELEHKKTKEGEICLQFYFGVRDYGTELGKTFSHYFIDKIKSGMSFYNAFKFMLKHNGNSCMKYRLIVEQIDIPTIAREN
jgi:hypothetical protein